MAANLTPKTMTEQTVKDIATIILDALTKAGINPKEQADIATMMSALLLLREVYDNQENGSPKSH